MSPAEENSWDSDINRKMVFSTFTFTKYTFKEPIRNKTNICFIVKFQNILEENHQTDFQTATLHSQTISKTTLTSSGSLLYDQSLNIKGYLRFP